MSLEETSHKQLELVTTRLENRIERQTRLLSYVGRKIQSDLSSLTKQYSDEFVEILSRTSGIMILEEELWKIEACSQKSRVAYPNSAEFLYYDPDTQVTLENENFYNLVTILRENPENTYIEIYADSVTINELEFYKSQITKHCGKAALNRVELRRCDQPIFTQYVIYDLNVSMLRDRHPSLYDFVFDHLADGRYVALLIAPQEKFHGLNFLADAKHCHLIIKHFENLLKHSTRV